MYEKLRNDFILEATKRGLSVDDINASLEVLDCAVRKYEVSAKELSLQPYDFASPEILEIYFANLRLMNYSEETIKSKFYALREMFMAIRKPVQQIELNDLRSFLDMKRTSVKASSLNTIRAHICAFFSWCASEGYIPVDISANLQKIKVPNTKRGHLDSWEMEMLKTSCDNLRDRALVEFMISTGCREEEIVNLKRSAIHEYRGTSECVPVLVYGKGMKERFVYVSQSAMFHINRYLESRTDDCPYLFATLLKPIRQIGTATVYKAIKKAASKAEFEISVFPHLMRHSFATKMLNSGTPITSIQALLGHAQINTTMHYADTNMQSVLNDYMKAFA